MRLPIDLHEKRSKSKKKCIQNAITGGKNRHRLPEVFCSLPASDDNAPSSPCAFSRRYAALGPTNEKNEKNVFRMQFLTFKT